MQAFERIVSTVVALPIDDIDTDQIIPARFLTVTDKSGLGEALFADWRYGADGRPRAGFPLNAESAQGARVLLAGQNFGCGSSREHAPWALLGYGFRAVISTRFADIFRNNALGNGLLPVAVTPAAHERLLEQLRVSPDARVAIDLESQTLTLPDGTVERFPIEPFDKHCVLHGHDRLGYLLAMEPEIAHFEMSHGPGARTTAEAVP